MAVQRGGEGPRDQVANEHKDSEAERSDLQGPLESAQEERRYGEEKGDTRDNAVNDREGVGGAQAVREGVVLQISCHIRLKQPMDTVPTQQKTITMKSRMQCTMFGMLRMTAVGWLIVPVLGFF